MFTQRSILSIEFALQLCLIELLMKLCSIKHHRTLICMFLGVYVMAQICLEVTNSLLEPILVYFFGYSNTQKGYKFQDLISHKVFVSRDV